MLEISNIQDLAKYVKRPYLALGVVIIVIGLITYGILQIHFSPSSSVDIHEPPVFGVIEKTDGSTVFVSGSQGEKVFRFTTQTLINGGTAKDLVSGTGVFVVGNRAQDNVLEASRIDIKPSGN